MLASMDPRKTLLTFDIGGTFHAEGAATDGKGPDLIAATSQLLTGASVGGSGSGMGLDASGSMPLQLTLGEAQGAQGLGKGALQWGEGAASEGQIHGTLHKRNALDTLSLRSPRDQRGGKGAKLEPDACEAEGSPSSARNVQPRQGGGVDLSSLERRGSPTAGAAGSQEKSSKGGSSRYESQKRRDWNTFGQYLRNHRPPLPMSKCTAQHVVEFLRYLDQFGKTKVHEESCGFFGSGGANPCNCPLKQAWGSLDSLIGRLRAAYEENGGTPDTNPFAQRIVRVYLREIREVQAKARGTDFEKRKRKRGGQGVEARGAAAGHGEASAAMAPSLSGAALGLNGMDFASLNALHLLDPSAALADLLGTSRQQPLSSSLDLAQLMQLGGGGGPSGVGARQQPQSYQELLKQQQQHEDARKPSREGLGLHGSNVRGSAQGSLGALQGLDMLAMPLEQQLLLEHQLLLQVLQKQSLSTSQPSRAGGMSGLRPLDPSSCLQDLAAIQGSGLGNLRSVGPSSQSAEKLRDQGRLMDMLLQAQGGPGRGPPPPPVRSMDALSEMLQASRGQVKHEASGFFRPTGPESAVGLHEQMLLLQRVHQRSSADPSSVQQGRLPVKEELGGSALAGGLGGTSDSSIQELLSLLQGRAAAAQAPLASSPLDELLKSRFGPMGRGLSAMPEDDQALEALLLGRTWAP